MLYEVITDFDQHNRHLLAVEFPSISASEGRELKSEDSNFFYYPNPWLTLLNARHSPEKWRDKYIFYGGYNDSQTGHPSNKLEDTGFIGGGDNLWASGVWEAGYLNDSPVPVTSSFFDKQERVTNHIA